MYRVVNSTCCSGLMLGVGLFNVFAVPLPFFDSQTSLNLLGDMVSKVKLNIYDVSHESSTLAVSLHLDSGLT